MRVLCVPQLARDRWNCGREFLSSSGNMQTKTALGVIRGPLFVVAVQSLRAVDFTDSFSRLTEFVSILSERSVQETEQRGQVALAAGSLLLFWWNRSRSGWFVTLHHRWSGWGTAAVAAGAVASGRATLVAATLDHFVTAQAESLFGLANHTPVAITQGTGQSGNHFWAAAAVLANLIADFVGSFAANSFISVIQGVDERGHDLWIADAIISVAELANRSPTLTSVASRLRFVDQLSDLAGIGVAALGCTRSGATGGGWTTVGGGSRTPWCTGRTAG